MSTHASPSFARFQAAESHGGGARANAADGPRRLAGATLCATILMAPIAIGGGWSVYSDWAAKESVRLAAIEAGLAYERLAAAPPAALLEVTPAAHGRDLFASVCSACHAPSGTGIHGLGKNLVESDFVASLDDTALHAFLVTGRPNARPAAMPPKGGRDDLVDADLHDLVVYLRGLQDPRRLPQLPAMAVTASAPSEAQQASALAAAGGDTELAGYIASGMNLFARTCAACHGADARGLPNLGKDLTTSQFVLATDDEGLLHFITKGRNPGEPGNTTGIAMPPKGGNPALSDDDMLDIISYLRSIQKPAPKAAASGK